MLQLLGPLDLVLGRELAQLVDRLGLEIGQVQAGIVVGVGREGAGEDGGVLAGRVVVTPARAEAALWRSAGSGVLAASRAASLLLRSRVVVHGRLACQLCIMCRT